MEYKFRKNILAKILEKATDEDRINYGIWYLLFFANQEIVRDSEYRIYSMLQGMNIIPSPNNNVIRYKGIISNQYKKAYSEYNKRDEMFLEMQTYFSNL